MSTSTEETTTSGINTTGICAHFGGSCYKIESSAVTWDEARQQCECSGGFSLATVTSAQENDFIQTLLGAGDAWIGLNDIATQASYVWADGTSLGSYSNWDTDRGNHMTMNLNELKTT